MIMKHILIFSWRNLFRNKRRSTLTACVISMGLMGLMFQDALFWGMAENLKNQATKTFLGEGQIHKQGFRKSPDLEKTISKPLLLEEFLKNSKHVKYFSKRVLSPCMLSSVAGAASVSLYGINPLEEKNISQVQSAIILGKDLNPKDQRGILLGEELAKTLDLKIGDRLIATATEAKSQDLSQELFFLRGVFKTQQRYLDQNVALINLEKAQSLLNLEENIHELALRFREKPSEIFWKKASQHGNEALSWEELSPSLKALLDISDSIMLISGGILMLLVALIITNSFFMMIFERIPEFAILRSIGTQKKQIFFMILLEAGLLGLCGIVMALFFGFFLVTLLKKIGIDYSGIDIANVTMTEALYPVLHARQFILYPLVVEFFSLFSALYPAFYTIKIKILDAMRQY